jgi:acylphosphatase
MSSSSPVGRRAVQVLIKGRVQGVWFRAWTCEKATELGVEGWIRNRPDGHVEGLFVGPGAAVDGLILACRGGPPLARVDEIECHEAPEAEVGEAMNQGFRSRPTS